MRYNSHEGSMATVRCPCPLDASGREFGDGIKPLSRKSDASVFSVISQFVIGFTDSRGSLQPYSNVYLPFLKGVPASIAGGCYR